MMCVNSRRDGQAELKLINLVQRIRSAFPHVSAVIAAVGQKRDFDSEARTTKGCKSCPGAQSSFLRPSNVFLNPCSGLFCLTSSTYNTVAVLLTAIVKCCETCLKKIRRSQVHSFVANIIAGLMKYKQIVFPLQTIPRGNHCVFSNVL